MERAAGVDRERRVIIPGSHDHHPGADEGFGPEPEFTHKKIDFSVVIGPAGQFVGIEDLPSYPLVRRAAMTVPKPQRRARELAANFLCDRTTYALGVRADPRSETGFKVDERAFACFRSLHALVLYGVTDTAVQAFLKFLDQWTPQDSGAVPGFRERLDLTLAFRFQYDDELLHERHAARLAWKRYLHGLHPEGA